MFPVAAVMLTNHLCYLKLFFNVLSWATSADTQGLLLALHLVITPGMLGGKYGMPVIKPG